LQLPFYKWAAVRSIPGLSWVVRSFEILSLIQKHLRYWDSWFSKQWKAFNVDNILIESSSTVICWINVDFIICHVWLISIRYKCV
jgi:hypothetical protein